LRSAAHLEDTFQKKARNKISSPTSSEKIMNRFEGKVVVVTTAGLEKVEAVTAHFFDRFPLGRAATPDEIASVIAFLASEDAAFRQWCNRAGRRWTQCVERAAELSQTLCSMKMRKYR
jgi:hypothetical protein